LRRKKKVALHLLAAQFSGCDPLVDTDARIEAAGVAGHGDAAAAPGDLRQPARRRPDCRPIGIFDLHMLAASKALDGRAGMHLGGVARIAASTPAAGPVASPRSSVQCGNPEPLGTARVESALPPARLTTSTPSIRAMASRCLTRTRPVRPRHLHHRLQS